MKRTHVMIGLASLVGAALIAGSALAVPAVFSPTGHLNVRSGPGFQYGVVAQMPANTRFPVTGCIQDYSWCSVVVGNVTVQVPSCTTVSWNGATGFAVGQRAEYEGYQNGAVTVATKITIN